MEWSELLGSLGPGAVGVVVGFAIARLSFAKIIERLMGMLEKQNQAMLDRFKAEGE